MKAAIFNPYLDTLGGGERYTLSFVKVLLDLGWKVDLEWKGQEIRTKLEKRFGISLKGVDFVEDIKRGDGYDLCFWVSDGSIPLLRARRNFLHFQIPFHNIGANNLLNKMKLIRVDKIICNSHFTKKIIDREYGVESVVLYPPVDTTRIKPKRKENIILAVARFSRLVQNKGQDVLIKAFKKINAKGITDWQLILAGGVEVGVDNYLEKLQKAAKGYPISIVKSPDFKELLELYGKSKIFWSASGYGIDEEHDPMHVEHFGITVVEAMSACAVPIVYNAGGHREIVRDKIDGFLWDSTSALVRKSIYLISNPVDLRKMAKVSKERSLDYDYQQFKEKIITFLK